MKRHTKNPQPNHSKAEFDEFARGYAAGMENPIKKLSGGSFEEFLMPKIDILCRLIASNQSVRVLDFGCGTCELLALLCQRRPDLQLTGCDISESMLEEARSRFPEVASKCSLVSAKEIFESDATFDLIYASCVFHHISPAEWVDNLRKLSVHLAPGGGMLTIIEHNPWNPLTSWVVAHTEIDRNACLLSLATTKRIYHEAGYKVRSTGFFLFAPPRFSKLAILDRWLRWLPLGGQYFCSASPSC